jgi:conjugative relaxase-like TrwC/TraI family protein
MAGFDLLETTLAETESHAATRVRMNGANEDRMAANRIVATYWHEISHELDPQLHAHAAVANLTYDGSRAAGRRSRHLGFMNGART